MAKQKYNGKTMQEIVDRKDWQEIRESFMGTWGRYKEENIKKLRAWLGNAKSADVEKLLIVYNYLTGTGFRTGAIRGPSIDRLRTEVADELRKRKEAGELVVERAI